MSDAVMPETDVQYEVWQGDYLVASSDALSDAQHYMAVYGQDGLVEAKTAVTTRFPGFSALAAPPPPSVSTGSRPQEAVPTEQAAPPVVGIQGFRRDSPDGSQQVGAEEKARDYQGPVADVSYNKDWLYISTDPYEGSAMLNIEALSHLIEALRRIESEISKPTPQPADGCSSNEGVG